MTDEVSVFLGILDHLAFARCEGAANDTAVGFQCHAGDVNRASTGTTNQVLRFPVHQEHTGCFSVHIAFDSGNGTF